MSHLSVNDLSFDELSTLISDAKAKIESESAERIAQIDEEIAELESRIAALRNEQATLPGSKSRVRNDRPLREYLIDAIRAGAATKQEIADAVLAAGYNTGSQNFKNNVYNTLQTHINKDKPLFSKSDRAGETVYSVVESNVGE